jgi:hypothetical protein
MKFREAFSEPQPVFTFNMKLGQVGRIKGNGAYQNMLVMRMTDGLVNIETGRETWVNRYSEATFPNFQVEVFPRGAQLIFTQED